MATNRSGNHLKYRYGICLNEKCEKGKSKEKQQILAHKDFVCQNPECGKPLRECPPPKPGPDWMKIGGIVVGVIVVVALVWWIIGKDSSDSETQANETVVEQPIQPVDDAADQARNDSLAKAEAEKRKADSIRAKQEEDSIKAAEAANIAKDKNSDTNTIVTPPQPKMPTVPFGVYSGPANGLGGEIKVTKPYTLDLRNANHDVIELLPGDLIKNVQIKNGELKAGMWQRGSERRSFTR